MLQRREELESKLDSVISFYNQRKRVSNFVREAFKQHGIQGGDFQEIWSKNKSLDQIELPILYLFTKYIYEQTNDSNIDIKDYFTELEIKDGNNYYKELKSEELTYPIVFQNVLRCRDDQFIMYLSIQKIKALLDNQIITYNFDTQRQAKHIFDSSGELISVASINRESVKEITNNLLNKKFITNCITINLIQDGFDSLVYDPKKMELVINSGQINVIDGFHRCLSMLKAFGENPSLDYVSEVRFVNFDIQKCRDFILQEDKRNKIHSRYLSSLNNDKWGNKAITKLNEGHSDLRNKITTDLFIFRSGKAYTMFDIMSNTIDLLWDFKSNMDVSNLTRWLSLFFDHIIGHMPEDFIEDVLGSREHSVITFPAMFVGYLALAKMLQDKENWKEVLFNLLDNADFGLSNPIWRKINIINSNDKPVVALNKSGIKNIVSYFEQLV